MTKNSNKNKNQITNSDKKYYFASANTCSGFKSYFNYIFNPELLNKIYIIKGGSGTGKSYLMNEIAQKAKSKNFSVEYFLCSSDPDSLDGIIIKDLGTAVIDGTAPHVIDPKYPGLVENIINLGNFWDENKLEEHRKEIFELINKKSLYFENAYKYLRAANEILEGLNNLAELYIDYAKMDASVHRIFNKYNGEKERRKNESGEKKNASDAAGIDEYRFVNSISSKGCETLDTLEREAKKIFYISNENFTGYFYTESLLKKFEESKKIILPLALNPEKIHGIYIKNSQTLYVIKDKSDSKIYDERYAFINMERFVSINLKKEHKQKLRFAKKCYNAAITSAVEYLKEARDLHFELEEIYKSSMDFNKKGEYSKDLIKKIFS